MKQESQTNQIKYSCFYKRCKFCRSLCQFCKLDVNEQHKTHVASEEDYVQSQQLLKQLIIDAKIEIFEYGNQINTFVGAISNDLKYVAIGGRYLKIWDHSNNNLIKTIQFFSDIQQVKFTDDSKILYVLTIKLILYKFIVNNKFKQVQTYQFVGDQAYINIYNMSKQIYLTSTYDGYICKINFQLKKQMQKIKTHAISITCLDYNKSLNIIATGSYEKSISLWNAHDGQLLIQKKLAHQKAPIIEVLFMINNQLISQDRLKQVIIWNIDYNTKKLNEQQIIETFNDNIQIVLHQQFIISTGALSIKIYSIDGELLIEFDHNLYNTYGYKLTQPDSMKSCIIFGESGSENKQLVFKIKYD